MILLHMCHLHAWAWLREVVVHLRDPRRKVLLVPWMPLDLLDSHPLVWVWHQDAVQEVPTFPGHLDVGWEVVLHLQYSLQGRRSSDAGLADGALEVRGRQGLAFSRGRRLFRAEQVAVTKDDARNRM